MAPELLTRKALKGNEDIPYSQSVDTYVLFELEFKKILQMSPYEYRYAFGCIMWEVLNFERIWGKYKFSTQVIDRVLNGERPEIPKFSGNSSVQKPPPGYIQLMRVCWHQTPTQRPKFDRVIEALRCLFVSQSSQNNSGLSLQGSNRSRRSKPPPPRPRRNPKKVLEIPQRSAHVTAQGEKSRSQHSATRQNTISTKSSDDSSGIYLSSDGIDDDML